MPPFSGDIRDGYSCGPRRHRHEGHGRRDAGDRPALRADGHEAVRDLRSRSSRTRKQGQVRRAWLVEHRPDLFEGVTEAIGEGGGFSYALDDTRRLYPIENAQRGMA